MKRIELQRAVISAGLVLFALLLLGAVVVGPPSTGTGGIAVLGGGGTNNNFTNATFWNSVTTTGQTKTAWSAYAIAGQTDNVWAAYNTNGTLLDYVKSNGTFTATSLGVGGDGENSAANPSLLLYGTNSSGQTITNRFTVTNSVLRIDSALNGAAFGAPILFRMDGSVDFNSAAFTISAGGNASAAGSVTISSSGGFIFNNSSLLTSPSDGIVSLLNNAQTSFTRLTVGPNTKTFPAWTVNGSGFTLTGGDGTSNSTNSLTIPGKLILGPSGASLTNILTGSATLDFPNSALNAVTDLPITVTGAASGDCVLVGVPQPSATGIVGTFSGFASNNTVFVRFDSSAINQDPASGTFKVTVIKF